MITQSLLDIYEREATHNDPHSPWYEGRFSDSADDEESEDDEAPATENEYGVTSDDIKSVDPTYQG